jgi:hypothetical protein
MIIDIATTGIRDEAEHLLTSAVSNQSPYIPDRSGQAVKRVYDSYLSHSAL